VPTIIGRAGALAHVEVELWPKEQQALQASARALHDTFARVSAA
jgi:L-lactate dehydrogenase